MLNSFLNKRSSPNYKYRKKEFSILLEISLYTGCAIGCDYCPQDVLNERSCVKYINFEDYKKYISSVPKNVYIVYAGFCEPLLYKDFENVVKYSYENGYKMLCATTLPTHNKNNIEIFLNEKYWVGRTVHLLDNTMNPKAFDTSLYFSNLEKYFEQISKKTNFYQEHTFSFLGGELNLDIEILLKKYDLYERFKKITPYQRIDAKVKNKNILIPSYKPGRIFCSENFYKKQLLVPGGDVVMCCMDVQKKHILGNLGVDSYKDLYNSKEYRKIMCGFNNDSIDTICRRCIYAKEA